MYIVRILPKKEYIVRKELVETEQVQLPPV